MSAYYAGIGSRETPPSIRELMRRLAVVYKMKFNLTLRSGGAEGADTAFEKGAAEQSVIYLPWPSFNAGLPGSIDHTGDVVVCGDDPYLLGIAEHYHPAWDKCTRGARALHARNVAQILGHGENAGLSHFLVCWTPRGDMVGGTAQAIRVAVGFGVPVYNLGFDEHRLNAIDFVTKHLVTDTADVIT